MSFVPQCSTIFIRYPESFEIVCSSLLIISASSLCGVLGTKRTEITSSGISFFIPAGWICGSIGGGGGGGGGLHLLWLLWIQGVLLLLSSFFFFVTGRRYQVSFTASFFLSLLSLASSLFGTFFLPSLWMFFFASCSSKFLIR